MAYPIVSDWSLILNEGTATATATLPTIGSGTNRIVLVGFAMYNGSGSASVPTSVTANGATAQLILAAPSQTRVAIGVYAFFETDIALISGQALNSTGGSGTQKSILVQVLEDRKQEIPLNSNIGYATATQTINVSLTRLAESFTTVFGLTSQTATSLTFTNPARTLAATLTSGRRVSTGTQNDTANTSDFVVSGTAYTNALAINLTVPAAYQIDSINSGSPIILGSSSSWVTSGFDPDVNTGSVDGVSMASVSAAGFGAFNLADGATIPRPGASRTVIAGNGSQSDSIIHAVDVDSEKEWIELSGTLYSGQYRITPDYATAGGIMIYQTVVGGQNTGTVVYADGSWSTNYEGQQKAWYIHTDNVAEEITIITGGGSIQIISRSITALGITSRGLVSVGL